MYVYILQSEKTRKYYCGQTQDLVNRLYRHNTGLEPYTKSGLPWKLIISFEVVDRSESMKLEKSIKQRGIRRYLEGHNLL